MTLEAFTNAPTLRRNCCGQTPGWKSSCRADILESSADAAPSCPRRQGAAIFGTTGRISGAATHRRGLIMMAAATLGYVEFVYALART
jgi:hypothetical protein